MDGTLLEAWASHISFRPKDGRGSDGHDFHGERRTNDTLASTSDPDARLMRKGAGKEAKLSYLANCLMENRHSLIVGIDVRHASGTDEREGALDLVAAHLKHGDILGADKGYDTQAFAATKAYIPRHTNGRRSAIDARKARGKDYAMNLVVRKRIEQGFGWVKTFGSLSKLPRVALGKPGKMW